MRKRRIRTAAQLLIHRLAGRRRYKLHRKKILAGNAQWAHANPAKSAACKARWHCKNKYGITLEEKATILTKQGNVCKICGSKTPRCKKGWHVDADHTVKPPKIRGILCQICNPALGRFKHNSARLRRAADYLDGILP